MSVGLTSEVKNHFIASARSFREGDEQSALNNFHAIGTQNPGIANQVYDRLWELMERPNRINFGRSAFWNQAGQSAPLPKRIQAIEDVLKTHIELSPITLPSPPPLPEGAKEVKLDRFVDCGFDPRFSFGGEYLLPEEKISFNWLCKKMGEWVVYLEFAFRAYLSFDPEERALRQMILSCAKTESVWGNQAKRTFVENEDNGVYSAWALEHEFLNKASAFYQTLHPESASTARLYPSELLHAIHTINKPQTDRWRKELAAPGFENGDLSRGGLRGLWRLRDEMYKIYNSREKRTIALDEYELHYVPHYIFINAIENQANDLKTAMREYRTELSYLITDRKCASSFEACKQRLMPKMHAFHTAWERYVNSHELLQEINALFSKEDPLKPMHDHQQWLMQMSQIPFFSRLYVKYDQMRHNKGDYWYDHYRDEGYKNLKNFMLCDFPETKSAGLLRAYENASS